MVYDDKSRASPSVSQRCAGVSEHMCIVSEIENRVKTHEHIIN